MKKNYFLKAVVVMLLCLLISCDNTTADPINQNNPNPPNSNTSGNTGNNGSTILGPRILHKIMAGNDVNEEYVTTAGVLSKAIIKEASGPNSYLIGTVTYTAGKVSKVKFIQEVNGVVPANTLWYDFAITYDASGKISNTVCNAGIGTSSLTTYINECVFTYDSAGKMTKIVEKRKTTSNVYTHFSNYDFINVGDNLTKVTLVQGTTSNSGVPDMSSTNASSYNFSYDSKINPYTTLPKTYFLMNSLLHPFNFGSVSANNVSSFSINYPAPLPSIPGGYTYIYDSQNYPTSDQTQTKNYIYKAL